MWRALFQCLSLFGVGLSVSAAWDSIHGQSKGWQISAGFPQAFLIFQQFLSSGDAAQYPNSEILLLLSPGLQDIEEGVLFQLLPGSAKYRHMLDILGIPTMIVALVLASCANNSWQILCTQGLLFGAGGIMLNYVHVSIFSEWFEKEKERAMTIIWFGYRTGAWVFPSACQWLLEKHGYETTLRVLIAPMLTLLLPSVALLRGRHEPATVVTQPVVPIYRRLRSYGILLSCFTSSLLFCSSLLWAFRERSSPYLLLVSIWIRQIELWPCFTMFMQYDRHIQSWLAEWQYVLWWLDCGLCSLHLSG